MPSFFLEPTAYDDTLAYSSPPDPFTTYEPLYVPDQQSYYVNTSSGGMYAVDAAGYPLADAMSYGSVRTPSASRRPGLTLRADRHVLVGAGVRPAVGVLIGVRRILSARRLGKAYKAASSSISRAYKGIRASGGDLAFASMSQSHYASHRKSPRLSSHKRHPPQLEVLVEHFPLQLAYPASPSTIEPLPVI
jgi:hypothetical protein